MDMIWYMIRGITLGLYIYLVNFHVMHAVQHNSSSVKYCIMRPLIDSQHKFIII